MVKELGFDSAEDADFVDIEGEAENISDLQNDVDSQMNRIFEEFGGDSRDTEFKIHVKRAVTGTGEFEQCFSCTPAELPIIDRIQHEYGHGVYEIWVYKDGKIFRRRKLRIAKPIRGPAPQNLGNTSTSEIPDVMRIMLDSNREMMERFTETISRVQSQPVTPVATDPMQMMTSMMAAMSQMKEFLGGGNQNNGLDLVLKGVELAKEIGGSDRETNLLDIVKQFGPGLLEVTNKIASQPQSPVQPNQQAAPQGQENMNPQMIALKHQVKTLVAKAAANADPALYADFIVDNVPEEQIKQFIARPDMIEFLGQIDPGVIHHQVWFRSLKDEIEMVLNGIAADTDDTDLTDKGSVNDTDIHATAEQSTTNETQASKGDATGNT